MSLASARKHAGENRPPLRPVRLGPASVTVERRGDGAILMRSPEPLPPYPETLTERLAHWAKTAPERIFLAQRDPAGGWRTLSYAATFAAVRAIAAALLERDLSPDRPVAILSGNDIEHALLGLAAMHVGIPYAPISVPYSLMSQDFKKLTAIIDILTPGLVFAANGAAFARAIAAAVPASVEVVVTTSPPPGRRATHFAELLEARPTAAVDAAHAAVGPDTVAKILFTSGSTGQPKGVINTQRMMCSNQAMVGAALVFVGEEPPVIVDWLPWNHTFGSNHNFNLVLHNGGSLYIDEGKPMPGAIEATVRNLRDVAPTVYFNVPKGYEMLLPHLAADRPLREKFFSRLKVLFYAGASLSQHVLDALQALAIETTGERIIFLSSLGSTETAPLAIACSWDTERVGNIGLPAPGVELKLVPREGKLEARLKGPNITPGYWRAPALTADAFDEEGFYKIGDAFKFADPAEPAKGLLFDGRLAEDFKLATGTWVSVGPLRAAFIAHCAPLARDVVFAGADRDEIAALVFPDLDACRKLAPDLACRCSRRNRARRRAYRCRVRAAPRGAGGAAPRHVRARPPRHSARRAALARHRRDHRQRIDQPARRARPPRRLGRRALRRPAAGKRHRRGSLGHGRSARELIMDIRGHAALVTGGGSGLGAATARMLAQAGAKVALLDVNQKVAAETAIDINGIAIHCDVADSASTEAAIAKAAADHGPARILINCAGIGTAKRIVGREGPMALADFDRVVRVNLIGTFNAMRLAAVAMAKLDPLTDDERGIIVCTASVAAYDGQIGQAAYASSKGGVVALVLPAAREFAQFGIRVNAIAPGIFDTPMLQGLSEPARESLAASLPFPKKLGDPAQFAALARHMIENRYLNGEVVRLDASLRMAPK